MRVPPSDDDGVQIVIGGVFKEPVPYCVTDDRLDLWPGARETTITDLACAVGADCEALGDAYEWLRCVEFG
jgi:hypothetical protein